MSDKDARAACPSNAETTTGALAAIALGNLAIVLAAGGYEATVFGTRIRSHTPARPLAILLVLLAIRTALTIRRVGLRRAFRGILPLGLPVAVVAAALFYTIQTGRASAVPMWASAVVGGAGLAGFVLAWLSWPPPPGAARIVVAALYIGGSWALACSLRQTENWERAFSLTEPHFVSDAKVPAERVGLLEGQGVGVTFEKVKAGICWRDAAVLEPGGFFSKKVSWDAPSNLIFEIARSADAAGVAAKVTLVGNVAGVHFDRPVEDISADSWETFSIELDQAGAAEVVFESTGDTGSGAILFANPRIVASKAQTDRLNVILIIVDALRSDRMGLYGYVQPTTPELEEAAAGAVIFDGGLAQSSWTVPSTATIFTSLYPSAHGTIHTARGLSGDLPTLASRLRASGYHTAAFQVNSLVAPQAGFARGFESYVHYPTRRPGALDPNRYVRAEKINRDALDWLEGNSSRPFFLYLHYMDVHDPYVPPEEFRKFGDEPSGLYDGEIAYFSSLFGAFFTELKGMGLLENTMLVLTSDHGEQFLEHGATKHAKALYSEEVGVPLVIWHPQAAPRRTDVINRGIDVAPTILEAAGAESLDDADGRSLMPAVAGAELEKLPVYSELHTIYPLGRHLVSLTQDGMRLIVTNPGKSYALVLELYDLGADPSEQINLAASDAERREAMLKKVEAFAEAQAALHKVLVPEEFVLPMSQERMKELEALGYANN